MRTIKRKQPSKYFLGGAIWDGKNDHYKEFIKKGIWRSGWGSDRELYMSTLEQIRPGDRIAIKKGLGQGNPRIQIRAIGIVKAVDLDEEFCTVYVDWLRTGMSRKVDSKGCYKTIHGPYSNNPNKDNAEWINKVFCI